MNTQKRSLAYITGHKYGTSWYIYMSWILRVPNPHRPQALTRSFQTHIVKIQRIQHECTRTHTDPYTHIPAHARTHTHTHQSHIRAIRTMRLKTRFSKRGFQGRFKRADRGRMADKNRELVPDNWSLVRERALTTGLCSEGWHSEHSGVCRRAELPGRSVKVKTFWKVDGSLMRNYVKAKQRQFVFDPLLNK